MNNGDIQLIITLTQEGKVNVHGPINDKILSLGLIEFAKQVILSQPVKQVDEKKIVAPSTKDVVNINSKKKGGTH